MTTIAGLRRAVEDRHCCWATLREIVRVVERSEGKAVWDGAVVVFNVIGNPFAEIAYAWYDPRPTLEGPRLHTVLHADSVDSPQKAVRLAIARGRSSEQAS